MSTDNALQELDRTTTSELAIPEDQQVAKYASDEEFDKLVSTYLPRLQLFDSNSGACKQNQIPIGEYGLVHNNNVIPLGKEVRLWVLSMRFKAMDLNGGVKSFFNPNNSEFKRIKEKSEGQNTGCLCGPEFLVYLPEQNKFATFFMSSKTMRREAPNVKVLRGKPCLLRTRYIQKAPYAWWGPVATVYSTPMTPPPEDRQMDELDRFNNPPESEIEAVSDTEAATVAARDR